MFEQILSLPTEREMINAFMDNIEVLITQLPEGRTGIKDVFAPGIYCRFMWVPRGSILTSKIHRTEHVFMVTKGRIFVYDGIHKGVILKAPFDGKTMPDTRRLGIALDDTIWVNIHPTRIKPKNESPEAVAKAVEKIERVIIEPYINLKLNGLDSSSRSRSISGPRDI